MIIIPKSTPTVPTGLLQRISLTKVQDTIAYLHRRIDHDVRPSSCKSFPESRYKITGTIWNPISMDLLMIVTTLTYPAYDNELDVTANTE